MDELIAFFRARKGKAYGFRFKDWTDYKATSQLIGTGDGAIKTFQLVKRYPSGSVVEVRTITKPIAGTVRVYKDGVEQLSGLVGGLDDRHRHLHDGAGRGRGGHRRLRARRAGAVRHRPHGGDHRELPSAPLAADPDRRAQDMTMKTISSGLAQHLAGEVTTLKGVCVTTFLCTGFPTLPLTRDRSHGDLRPRRRDPRPSLRPRPDPGSPPSGRGRRPGWVMVENMLARDAGEGSTPFSRSGRRSDRDLSG
jgi:hypothetical protein